VLNEGTIDNEEVENEELGRTCPISERKASKCSVKNENVNPRKEAL